MQVLRRLRLRKSGWIPCGDIEHLWPMRSCRDQRLISERDNLILWYRLRILSNPNPPSPTLTAGLARSIRPNGIASSVTKVPIRSGRSDSRKLWHSRFIRNLSVPLTLTCPQSARGLDLISRTALAAVICLKTGVANLVARRSAT